MELGLLRVGGVADERREKWGGVKRRKGSRKVGVGVCWVFLYGKRGEESGGEGCRLGGEG